jgi:hypothetical protein
MNTAVMVDRLVVYSSEVSANSENPAMARARLNQPGLKPQSGID